MSDTRFRHVVLPHPTGNDDLRMVYFYERTADREQLICWPSVHVNDLETRVGNMYAYFEKFEQLEDAS